MLTDRELTFSNNQAVTTGTEYSTDKYDASAGAIGNNVNTGRSLKVVVRVTTAFSGGTNLTVNFVESPNSDLSSPTVLATSGAIAEASLTAGARLIDTVVPRTSKRYLGLQFVSSGTHGAGKVWGGIVLDSDDATLPAFETGY